MLKKKYLRGILITTLCITSLCFSINKLYASSISPSTKAYTVSPEDLLFEQLEYKNDTKAKEIITLSVGTYDAKSEKSLTNKPFITISHPKYTVNANSKIKIDYIVTIPTDTPGGTYFNVIYIQKQDSTKNAGNVAIIPSIGVLFTFHVQESNATLDKIFFDKSEINLVVKQKGLPYFLNTEFEYTYTNNSNFVFKPEGEIRILDSKNQQLSDRFEINPNKKTIYPGESFTQSFSVNLWKDINSILTSKSIVSKTYSDIDGSSVLNKVELSILSQVGVIAIVAVIILLSLLTMIISGIVKSIKSKKK